MVILLNNRVEFKIEVVILVVRLDKKVELKYIDLVKMFFIVIS